MARKHRAVHVAKVTNTIKGVTYTSYYLPLDFGHWMVDRAALNLRVLNPALQGSTRCLGLRPPAPGPLRRGDRRRRRNYTRSESEADPRAFQVGRHARRRKPGADFAR